MTGPRTKRQFAGAASDPAQRQITSFFAKTSSTGASNPALHPSHNHAALNGPVIPDQVQTDLLTVGMRVRKAIPEGYKTGAVYSAFTLWADDMNNSTAANSNDGSTTPRIPYTSTMRELEPFCGLNKVGGLAFQPAHTTPSYDDDDFAMSAPPSLTSSQDTLASTASFSSSFPSTPYNFNTVPPTRTDSTTTRKRIFTVDEDDASSVSLPYRGRFRLPQEQDGADCDEEEEISPRSLAPPRRSWENERVLAVPRRARQKGGVASALGGGVGAAGQEENVVMMMGRKGQDGNDFEEASFLDYALGEGMEVE
ncbi:ribonucleotide reductase inhibitor-domain-containing protein [Staphylotrichum tortipilum]|uniref:Ribonucleotide reductase inhibitor-domain-containing protein n=1 Tax=Staphylotrichum tortipilum TaxID=2831512 RepID=A0AAN6MCZ2_9PEZI|nr:ribonucleotide reductase inhibitor-domain-containing protein [Staphylotrichum longicolle]